ncbi:MULTISPECIES: BLUF domain-containing protein [unclassified Sphingobium]|uniref:BLUF domain-containing protein n=1 Tax=unclassified Sphingobium TaxID=2611147 RepID=UPI0035A5C61F
MSIHQIMYISSVTDAMTSAQCAAIARGSAERNAAEDVTGLLLFNSRRFLQVLEGPKEAVERIYARIARDGRHGAIVKLREQSVPAREFGAWDMAYDDPAHPSEALKDKVAALLEQAGASTRAHFIGTAEMHRG